MHVLKYSCGTSASFVEAHTCVVKIDVTNRAPLQGTALGAGFCLCKQTEGSVFARPVSEELRAFSNLKVPENFQDSFTRKALHL